MSIMVCNKCGEHNPPEAVMCWACYTPLPGHEGEIIEPPVTFNGVYISSDCLAVASGLVISAGCLRSRGPWRILFYSLGAVLASFHIYRTSIELAAQRKRADEEAQELSPIERIANAIFMQAVKDKARAIRIQAFQRGVAVHYFVQGDWHEQMKVPKYIWKPLMTHLRLRAGLLDDESERGAISVTMNSSSHLMNYSYDAETETALLEFV